MSHEGNVQFASGQPLHSPISLGAPNGPSSHNLLGGSFQVVHSTPNRPVLSTSSQQTHQSAHPATILKLSGLPPNLSQREAGLIFSLAIDDLISIDFNEKDLVLKAVFKNPNTCMTAARILDGKFIFGGKEGPVKVEYDVNFSLAGTPTAFENLRLSNPKATPPGSQQMHQQPGHQVSVSNPTSSQLQHSAGAAGIESYQKRSSVGNQRSRFLFSDPFSGQTTPTNPTSGSIDLSDLTGKSLLLMKSNDGREHETTPRDPWGSHSQGNIGYTSNTQTPGLNSVQSQYDWGSGTTSQTKQLLHNSHAPQIQPTHSSSVPQQMTPYVAQVSADRRKTSSFFNGPPGHFANQLSLGHESQPQQSSSSPQRQSPTNTQPLNHTDQQLQTQSQHPSQSVATIKSQGPAQQHQQGTLPSLTIPPGSAGREGSKSSTSQISNSQMSNSHITGISAPTSARSPSKDLPELSLLARVPPPANPADQNPPCNTLYVGNLPPDATESELRSLFAPQNGFRRLSFRTKNQSAGSNGSTSSHNHGPMCFVEFEDVAYATVALAELYGRPLPRPSGSNGKGGIRLSFSKNPLGVRGPGNPRRASTNSQPSSAGSGNNGVGNYGYSNYH